MGSSTWPPHTHGQGLPFLLFTPAVHPWLRMQVTPNSNPIAKLFPIGKMEDFLLEGNLEPRPGVAGTSHSLCSGRIYEMLMCL